MVHSHLGKAAEAEKVFHRLLELDRAWMKSDSGKPNLAFHFHQ
jgi:hypothetical protein